jgi:hypothetical protein
LGAHPLAYGAQVVAQMHGSRRLNAGKYSHGTIVDEDGVKSAKH